MGKAAIAQVPQTTQLCALAVTPDATSTALFFDKRSPKLTASDQDMLDAYVSAYKRENSSEPITVEGYASLEGDAKFIKLAFTKKSTPTCDIALASF